MYGHSLGSETFRACNVFNLEYSPGCFDDPHYFKP